MTASIDTRTSTVELSVKGMTCGSCRRRVGDALAAVAGAAEVTVSLREGSASIRWATGVPDVDALIDAVRGAGYDATVTQVSGAAAAPRAPAVAGCGCGARR